MSGYRAPGRDGEKKKNCTKKHLMTQLTMMMWSLTQSQISCSVNSSRLQEALLQIKLVEVMKFQLSYFKSYKMMLLKCCTHYASKHSWKTQLENSVGKLSSDHRTGKFSFQSNHKESQCQRMVKLLHNCTHFTCQENYAQNSSGKATASLQTQNFQMFKLDLKKQRNQRSNCQHMLGHRKRKGMPKKHLPLLHLVC